MTRARDLANFVSNAQGDVRFDTDTLFIDSSANRVGIGTDTPATKLSLVSNGAGGDIHVKNGSGQNALLELAGNDNTCGSTSALFGQVTDNTVNLFNRANANLVFGTNNAERMRIDSSGRAMVGTTTEGNAAADDLTLSGSGHVGMTIRSTDSTSSRIYFADATSGTGEYTGYFLYNHSNNSLQVGTNGAERIRVDSDGLKFNGDTAAANALNDYEEGSWTPAFDSGYSSITYAVQVGSYTKIGDTVRAYFRVYMSSATTTADVVRINGLPYASVNNNHVYHTGTHYTNSASAGGEHSKLLVFPNDVRIYLYSQNETGVSSIRGNTSGASLDILGQVIYQAT